MLKDLSPEVKRKIEETINHFSFDEKIGQIVCERFINIAGKGDIKDWLKKYPVGAVYVGNEVIDSFKMTSSEVRNQVETLQKCMKVPTILVSDFEQGVGGQLSDDIFTLFPESMAIAAGGDPHDAYEAGRIAALEAGELNVHCCFSTVTDLAVNVDNPIVGIRSFGDDPDRVIPYVLEHIRGLQEHNCSACAKHFPGDGIDNRNQHYVTSFNPLPMDEWRKTCGKVWKAVIDAGVTSIMIGHLAMPEFEPMDPVSQKYRPATVSRRIMTDLLRGELGYKGVVITDAMTMNGFCSWADYDTRMLDSLHAGADLMLWPDTEHFFEAMHKAHDEGRLSEPRLDDAVRHVLEWKARFDLHAKPFEDKEKKIISARMAEKGVALLRNTPNGLPLKKEKDAKYYVLVTPSHAKVLDAVQPFCDTLSEYGSVETDLIENADWEKADNANAVILLNLGRVRFGDYKGMHKKVWPLMARDQIRKRIVIGMANPFFLRDVPSCDTYIAQWSAHPAAQRYSAKGLFGDVSFTGKSPITIQGYVRVGQNAVKN